MTFDITPQFVGIAASIAVCVLLYALWVRYARKYWHCEPGTLFIVLHWFTAIVIGVTEIIGLLCGHWFFWQWLTWS